MLEKLFEFTKNSVVYDVFYNSKTASLQVINMINADEELAEEDAAQLALEVTDAFYKDKCYRRIKKRMEQAAAKEEMMSFIR